MKCILLAIQPKWCELIASGKKTIEVRKTRPKIETPFTVYVYMTKHKWIFKLLPFLKNRFAKVIGSFVCDRVEEYEGEFWDDDTYERIQEPWEPSDFAEYGEYEYDTIGENGEFYGKGIELSKQSCLSWNELRKYVGQGLKDFYGWHITEPTLFEKPRGLGEFRKPCDFAYDCCACQRAVYKQLAAGEMIFNGCNDKITRPPQSWCYVEELQ